MEKKAVPFELKDMDKSKRTALVAHAIYNNIDRTDDISRKGMFTKSWSESKEDINFYLNHNDEQAPGKVLNVKEDDNAAYTEVWCGTHTLGNDVLTMMDEGIIKKASFGYITMQKNFIDVKGKKVRELKEVQHLETSVLTKLPANPLAGVRQVIKSFGELAEIKELTPQGKNALKTIIMNDQATLEQLVSLSGSMEDTNEFQSWINYTISRRADLIGDVRGQLKYNSSEMKELKEYVKTMEKFCKNTKASDDCIKSVLIEIDNAKILISEYDTAVTQHIEPDASIDGKSFLDALTTFKKTLII